MMLIGFLIGVAATAILTSVGLIAWCLHLSRRDEAEAAARARRIAEGVARELSQPDQMTGLRLAMAQQRWESQ